MEGIQRWLVSKFWPNHFLRKLSLTQRLPCLRLWYDHRRKRETRLRDRLLHVFSSDYFPTLTPYTDTGLFVQDVKRVYFGNWLRDYSQAVDVGTVKYVSSEAIRIVLWVLAFMSFGYGTGEFEVTRDRLGCQLHPTPYSAKVFANSSKVIVLKSVGCMHTHVFEALTDRSSENADIDNPKDYADNLDARDYDRRLRGPIDERRELSIDERTGLKHYIASEDRGITTSAAMVRELYTKSIQLGRRYKQSRDERDLYEALRLLGTANHCLEDYSAHSNYVELALIELGEDQIFPHVGRSTKIRLQGARQPVYPIVTGTFGGVDFLHSVMGEISDKTTQSELQELEGTINGSQRADTSLLKELLGAYCDESNPMCLRHALITIMIRQTSTRSAWRNGSKGQGGST